jgi:hypothetical protein
VGVSPDLRAPNRPKEVNALLHVALHAEFDVSLYRNDTHLRDGTKVLIRPLVAEDMEALHEFFKALPREETRYLRDDVSSHLIIEKWAKNIDDDKTLPILALKEGKVIADNHLKPSWSRLEMASWHRPDLFAQRLPWSWSGPHDDPGSVRNRR